MSIFEVMMLVCFGVSWPISIAKSLRTRFVRGKSAGLGSDNPLGVQDNILPAYGVPDTDLYPVLTAMKEITGKTFDSNDKDFKTWLGWWKSDGQKFVFKD